ncbi:MAG: HugZ family protein [Oceanicaulis sp.]
MTSKPATSKDMLQPVDDAVRRAARTLLREARSCTLATLTPQTGAPAASRALLCVDPDGAPVVFLSGLSAHSAALQADPRASLLVGEPGGGDPLAHARLSVSGEAMKITDPEAHARARARCLARHPRAELYIDLPDFAFWRIEPSAASFVAGFGRAHALNRTDLTTPGLIDADLARSEAGAVEHMNDDHADAVALYATAHLGEAPGAWALAGIDASGLDLRLEDRLRRLWFDAPLSSADEMRPRLVQLAKAARRVVS